MKIEIILKGQTEHTRVDYLSFEKGRETITVDWDTSEISPGNVLGRGVCLNGEYAESDALKGFRFSDAQLYRPEEDKEIPVSSKENPDAIEAVYFYGEAKETSFYLAPVKLAEFEITEGCYKGRYLVTGGYAISTGMMFCPEDYWLRFFNIKVEPSDPDSDTVFPWSQGDGDMANIMYFLMSIASLNSSYYSVLELNKELAAFVETTQKNGYILDDMFCGFCKKFTATTEHDYFRSFEQPEKIIQVDQKQKLITLDNEFAVRNLIVEMQKDAVSSSEDETDFYSDLLEFGITTDRVRSLIGKESAEHMQAFCEDHGLL